MEAAKSGASNSNQGQVELMNKSTTSFVFGRQLKAIQVDFPILFK